MRNLSITKHRPEIVMVTGGNGQLGSDLVESLLNIGYEVLPKTHLQFDITQMQDVKDVIKREKPNILINTAAFHQVEECENDPDLAMVVNSSAPAHLAKICAERGIRFVHFSTDYVFDGKKGSPYTEQDLPAPLNTYGKSKYQGEQDILKANPDALIIRISAIYGVQPCRAKKGLNFVRLMMKLADEQGKVKVVDDEFVSPTSTLSIARMMPSLLDSPAKGIMHLSSEGSCSWYEFAKEIFHLSGRDKVELTPVKSTAFPAKVARPAYSVLQNQYLSQLGLPPMPHWKESLEEYIHLIEERQRPSYPSQLHK